MSYSNSFLLKIYYTSPTLIKSLISGTYGMLESKKRYGNHFRYWLNLLKKYEFSNNEELIKFRDSQLLEFIDFTIKNCKFYNHLEKTDINQFPILNKQDLRKNYDRLIISNYNERIKRVHTSGTTGSSLIFPLTISCFQREYSFRAMHYWWAGIDVLKKPRIATFSGHPVAKSNENNPPFWVYDFYNNWLLFSSYHIKNENEKYYIEKLKEFSPEVIHGYPSSVYLIAKAFKKYGTHLKNLKAIFTASESLLDLQRKEIEEAFQVKVFNWYGNTEMCANIVECEKGNLHLKYEHSYVEILNESNNSCKPGEIGRLICTNFCNRAFPIIRYDIGDVVKISNKQKCECNRGGLIIDFIEGRIEDYVITTDGRKIGRLDHLFKDTLGIKEAQIIQNQIGEITIKYVPDEMFTNKDLVILEKECYLRFGNNMKVNFEEVGFINRTQNGKMKFIISNLN